MSDSVVAKSIDDLDLAAYDAQAKGLLSNKIVLAHILKGCVEEFKHCSINDIANKYIEGVPEIDVLVDREDVSSITKGPKIQGLPNEDTTVAEGKVSYDIRFNALVPNSKGILIKLVINVEAQKTENLGYSIIKRAIYYCARLISAQKNVEFTGSDYDNIKKVYSIWICYDSAKTSNTITRFRIIPEDVIRHKETIKEDYDMLQVILIELGKPLDSDLGTILHMLDVVFDENVLLENKKAILEDCYDIPMTEDINKELSAMCNIGEGIWEHALRVANENAQKMVDKKVEEKVEENTREIAWSLYNQKMSVDFIANVVKKPVEVINKWLGLLPANA